MRSSHRQQAGAQKPARTASTRLQRAAEPARRIMRVEAMKEDSRAIFRAASEAQKAVDYIMERTVQVDRMAAE